MPYLLIQNKDFISTNINNNIIKLFIIILLYSIIKYISKNYYEYFENNIKLSAKKSKCSKNCCSIQWKVPIDVTEKSNVSLEDISTSYNTSNLNCNDGIINTGCVCIPKNTNNINLEPSSNSISVFNSKNNNINNEENIEGLITNKMMLYSNF